MKMKKKYQSDQLMVCHQDAEALYQIGAITEAQMQEFDQECLIPEPAPKTGTVRKAPAPAYPALGGHN
jgi:DNA-binding transcriptional regulator YiaG